MQPKLEYLTTGQGRKIAYRHNKGRAPTVVFLCGFRSDMTSTKATTLMDWCVSNDRDMLCFDYSGHGQSSGVFAEGSIGNWLEDAIAVFELLGEKEKILVGSSMGGWIAFLLALRKKLQVAGIITLACAADFVSDILIPALSAADRESLNHTGVTFIPSEYEDRPYAIGQTLLDDPGQFEILKGPIELDCPVDLIHGLEDRHIPWETSLKAIQRLTGSQSRLTLIKDASHRLSRPEDLEVITRLLTEMIDKTEYAV